MAGEKRQRGGGNGNGNKNEDRSAKKRRYTAAAGKSKAKASGGGEIRGPGLWLSCARRKEAISTSEAYDLLNDVADRLYPGTSTKANQATQGSSKDLESNDNNDDAQDIDEDDIEAQIAKELEELQPARDPETGKKKMRFQGVRTDTECLIWISCAPPLDPVKLAYTIADDLQNGGPVRTRFLQRITPVTNTTHADPNSLKRLAYRILQPLIAPSNYTVEQRDQDEPIKYRIEPSLRNHSASLNRQVVTDIVGEVVRDLANASFQFPKRQPGEENINNEKSGQPEGSNVLAGAAEENAKTEDETNATGQSMDTEQAQPSEQTQAASASKQEVGGESTEEDTPWHVLPPARTRVFVDLKNPTHTILVSALKGVCGMSVVEGYDARKRFNVQVLGGTLPPQNGNKSKEAEGEEEGDAAAAAEGSTKDAAAETVQLETTTAESAQPETTSSEAKDPASEQVTGEASIIQVQEKKEGNEQMSEVKDKSTTLLEETNVA